MAGRLKPLDVARQVTPGKYPDGGGLHLIVKGPTSRNWSYRYWKDGKERWHGLGSLKDVSLAEARLKRDAARLIVKGDRNTAGIDIVEAKRAARQEVKAVTVAATMPTFEQCAESYVREHWSLWSEKHRAQWPASLKTYAYSTIGELTIAEIKPSHIFELLAPIWIEKRETANRVRGRIETIIAKNVDVDDTDFRNPAELTKQLREKLPRRPKRVVRHHPALPYAEASQFMTDLSAAGGTAASMLRFLILTACRTNEVVDARWSEIDRASSTWKIPGERMKMHQDHFVPLSDPALAILDKMHNGCPCRKPNTTGEQQRIGSSFCSMIELCKLIWCGLVGLFRSRASLEIEILTLRHQLNILRRKSPKRPTFGSIDRMVFAGLYGLAPDVLSVLAIVRPETVIRWHRAGFRLYWRWRSRRRGGRPKVPVDVRQLIRDISIANPLWGAPRIHGELLKLGIDVGQTTVAKYMARGRRPPSQGWK